MGLQPGLGLGDSGARVGASRIRVGAVESGLGLGQWSQGLVLGQ